MMKCGNFVCFVAIVELFRLMVFCFQWIDRDGKTPLIVASMNPELHNVTKTLIELGANVNAYRPGNLLNFLGLKFAFLFHFLLYIRLFSVGQIGMIIICLYFYFDINM